MVSIMAEILVDIKALVEQFFNTDMTNEESKSVKQLEEDSQLMIDEVVRRNTHIILGVYSNEELEEILEDRNVLPSFLPHFKKSILQNFFLNKEIKDYLSDIADRLEFESTTNKEKMQAFLKSLEVCIINILDNEGYFVSKSFAEEYEMYIRLGCQGGEDNSINSRQLKYVNKAINEYQNLFFSELTDEQRGEAKDFDEWYQDAKDYIRDIYCESEDNEAFKDEECPALRFKIEPIGSGVKMSCFWEDVFNTEYPKKDLIILTAEYSFNDICKLDFVQKMAENIINATKNL